MPLFLPIRIKTLKTACIALIATSGIRIDNINTSRIVTLILIIAGFIFHHFVAEHWSYPIIVGYFATLFLIRYVYLFGGFGKRGFVRAMIARHGESKAWDRYELITSILFFQRGLCFGLLVQATRGAGVAWNLLGPSWCLGLGVLFTAVGLWINVASCQVIGIDTYFYKDLFLRRPAGDFKIVGPYKYFRNPMYGIGQLSAYGAALMVGSTVGLMATVVNQVVMYVFYYLIERPHIRSLFPANTERIDA